MCALSGKRFRTGIFEKSVNKYGAHSLKRGAKKWKNKPKTNRERMTDAELQRSVCFLITKY